MPLSTARLIALAAAIALALAACAPPPVSTTAAPGAAGAGCDLEPCAAGLECVMGTCIEPCQTAADCGDRACLPMPGGATGWCALDGDTPPDDGPTSPAPPLDRPSPDADGDTPAPGALPPPKDPGAGETPPPQAEAPAPPTDVPPADDGEPPAADEAPAPDPAPDPDDQPPPPALPEEEAPPPPPCAYPGGVHGLSAGAVVPNLAWTGAYDGQGRRVDFDLERFHCDPSYDRYSILAVIVGAEWCGACAQYLGQLAAQTHGIDAAGALILFIETQDNSYGPANHEVARRVIDRHAPGAPGLRIGDGATRPVPSVIANSPIVQSYPTAFAVRRRDMRVIAQGAGRVDFAALARQEMLANPPSQPDATPPPAGCEEEALEPNDDAGGAAPIGPGDEITGGICNGTADFYRVGHDGFWTLDLRFTHAQGDLDVYVWDAIRGAPMVGLDGNPVGSASDTDNEQLIFLGEQVVMVTGYNGARAPYSMRVTGH